MFRGSISRAQRTASWTGVVAATAALVAMVAACDSSGGLAGTSTAAPLTSPTISAAEGVARDAAMAAFNGYTATLNRASKTADTQDPDFRTYLGDPLRGDIVYSMSQLNKAGLVQVGDVKYEPAISQVLLDQPVKTVIISSCVDSSDVKIVIKATKNPVPQVSPNASRRTKIEAEAVRYDDGRWLVRKSTKIPGATC